MNPKVRECLIEALRRYHSFHPGEPITKAWTGLGMPSAYKAVCAAGYMQPVVAPRAKCLGWYTLTEAGAAQVLKLANEGIAVRDYSVTVQVSA